MSKRSLNDCGSQVSLQQFLAEQSLALRVDEPLKNHCTWRIGGPADYLVEPASWKQVGAVLRWASDRGVPAIVIGKGSNLLFDDAGFRGIVIKIGRKLSHIAISGTTVRAESGISAPRLARAVGLAGLGGLEHIVGIPGTLGGLVAMNGGSQRKAIGDVITEVTAMDRQGATWVFARKDSEFSYRHSRFQNEHLVVTEVVMELASGNRDAIMSEMLEILRERRRKFPLTMPNCGSVFKSTPDLYDKVGPPGAVIEKLGLKGFRVGDAMVDTKHANFLVNVGQAKASEVLELTIYVSDRVHEQTRIRLESEAQYVTSNGRIIPISMAGC
jgi:UDP-N-acetylmuramate dehydrogenase